MWCAFTGNPRIARVYGRGVVHPFGSTAFGELASQFAPLPGRRSIIEVDVERVSLSCGYAVPLMHYEGERDRLTDWATKKGDDGIVDYWGSKNTKSIDGLPGLPA
jgi:hypothetical protein